jgi:hypothetical protein
MTDNKAQNGTPIVPSSGEPIVSNGSYVAPVWMRFFNNLVGTATAGSDVASQIGVTIQAYDPQLSSLIRQNSQSADYTLQLTDIGYHIYHPSADTAPRTWLIPANSAVAFPIGTPVTFVNDTGAGAITIAINNDTLVFAGVGTTGNRTLGPGCNATALKIGATRWQISGSGLT